jgi:hypothetical protein
MSDPRNCGTDSGKVALITGGSGDIGRAVARSFPEYGRHLVDAFLAGADRGWVNGPVLRANGGFASRTSHR